MARLDGKVALITGAGTGIGRATARAMAAEGAKVVVAEINAEAGEQTAQIVAQVGGDCIAVATDVTQEDTMSFAGDAILSARLLSSTTADFGPEVVINLPPSPAARSPTCR